MSFMMSELQKKHEQFLGMKESRIQITEGLHKRLFENNNINYKILFEHYDTLKYGHNCGYEWDSMEDNILINILLKNDKNLFEEKINKLTQALHRSPQEIKDRIIHHGKKAYYNENISIDKVCKVFGLQKSDIIEYTNYNKENTFEEAQSTTTYEEEQEESILNRSGEKWTGEEDIILMEKAPYTSLEELSKIHKRNIGGIKLRIIKNAYIIMQKENKSIEDVCKLYHINMYDMKKHIQIVKNKNRNKEDNIEQNTSALMNNILKLFITSTAKSLYK
jgi:hypothetical protein